MFMLNLSTVLLIQCLCYSYNCSTPASDNIYQKSLSALITPSLCQLKLICVISQSGNLLLINSHFMQGISVLASYRGNRTVALMLEQAIGNGTAGGSCSSVAPDCRHSDRDLLLASKSLGLTDTSRNEIVRRRARRSLEPLTLISRMRRQAKTRLKRQVEGMSLSDLPRVFRPGKMSSKKVCKVCDERSTVCTTFSVGTSVGCFVFSIAGPGVQLACKVATAPMSIACGMNTLHCYLENCGLVSF